jgi:sugar phosphate isomerase/epimerase
MIRLGGNLTLDEETAADPVLLARAHTAKGYTAAYAPQIALSDTDRIQATKKAFADEGIMIAEVGFWQNMLDLDDATRAANREGMLDALARADALGAACAVNILGMYNTADDQDMHGARNFSEEAFDAAVELARYFIDTVEPEHACFTYEIYPFNVIDCPSVLERLLKAVDRDRFAIHMDLVNLMNCPRTYWRSAEVMRECISLFGDRIVSSHAKDVKLQPAALSVIMEEVIPGEGDLDLGAYMRELHALPHDVPFMLEHLPSAEAYDQGAAHLRTVAADEGISI